MAHRSTVEELVALGWQLHANRYEVVRLAARYDTEFDWFHEGLPSAAAGITRRLRIHASTAREWIRVGHSLEDLPMVDAAFRANEISYAQARILTRWANPANEAELLVLAHAYSTDRLTTAVSQFLAADEDDEERDRRHHDQRSVTSYTDGDGMVVIRAVLPPAMAKPILAAIDKLVEQIARMPRTPVPKSEPDSDRAAGPTTQGDQGASMDASDQHSVIGSAQSATQRDPNASTDAFDRRSVTGSAQSANQTRLRDALDELERRWQPGSVNGGAQGWSFPTLAQQRADALCVLFLQQDISLTTEVVIHIRGDGNTFNDGTPITTNAITRQLDHAFVRLMIHDAHNRPVNASNRRRHPTVRQKRVAMEAGNHQCVDCGSVELLELDHNPPYQQTNHTMTDELEPRCAPCHRARHRT